MTSSSKLPDSPTPATSSTGNPVLSTGPFSALPVKESILLALVAGLIILWSVVFQVGKTNRRTARLSENRRVFSTSSLYFSGLIKTDHIFDRNLKTAWVEDLGPLTPLAGITPPVDWKNPVPDPRTLQITIELALSHFPGNPPTPNPLHELTIWSGNQKSPGDFQDFARPRRVRIIFYEQRLVDIDKEYRLMELPHYIGDLSLELKDSPRPQNFDLSFLPRPAASTAFPENISQVWMRIIVESIYPGKRYRNRLAISEIDYRQAHRTIPEVLTDR